MSGSSARGLFCATGKTARPVMADLINGEAVYVDKVPREKDDFYPTPAEPTRAILNAEIKRLQSFPSVWESACGDGAMTREIEAAGLNVFSSDMVDRGVGAEIKSFYGYDTAPSKAILTNPPFNECNSGRWITHALDELGVEYMALLLPLNWAGAKTRGGLWSRHAPARVYLMRWRVDFTGAGAPPMLNAWYVWDGKTDPADTRFLMLDRSDAEQEGLGI
tara:strand:+ start:857 stop:1516 length:660 start_codon:yes stop_codon:yes gene_type:complete